MVLTRPGLALGAKGARSPKAVTISVAAKSVRRAQRAACLDVRAAVRCAVARQRRACDTCDGSKN
eukprot:3607272-Pleurochrysis_carterae.AAC.1